MEDGGFGVVGDELERSLNAITCDTYRIAGQVFGAVPPPYETTVMAGNDEIICPGPMALGWRARVGGVAAPPIFVRKNGRRDNT